MQALQAAHRAPSSLGSMWDDVAAALQHMLHMTMICMAAACPPTRLLDLLAAAQQHVQQDKGLHDSGVSSQDDTASWAH